MFTQSFFINKNTPELRDKLRELGGIASSQADTTLSCLVFQKGVYTFVDSKPDPVFDLIDCTDNEPLALALAALRTGSDNRQWFVCGDELDSWFLCEDKKVENFIHNEMDGWDTDGYRKATPEELLIRFKEIP